MRAFWRAYGYMDASFGPASVLTCAQAVDNTKALTTACAHVLALRPHTHRHINNFYLTGDKHELKEG